MNWDKIKDTLHLDKLNSSDIPTGAFGIVGVVVLVIAFKSGKFVSKMLLGLAALVLAGAAVWWHLHNR
ncbi:MAG TPA: hypothetical protein VNZ64_10895 [Candidatus Acidoferrum sp.]|jgi:hypothetical protein|nr:hypothetical protein [Candidatus Acidoferrum sp.]